MCVWFHPFIDIFFGQDLVVISHLQCKQKCDAILCCFAYPLSIIFLCNSTRCPCFIYILFFSANSPHLFNQFLMKLIFNSPSIKNDNETNTHYSMRKFIKIHIVDNEQIYIRSANCTVARNRYERRKREKKRIAINNHNDFFFSSLLNETNTTKKLHSTNKYGKSRKQNVMFQRH